MQIINTVECGAKIQGDVNGTYDVEESVSALIRTDGTVITLEGAWAQNIDEHEDYLGFIGTKVGIRLSYCGGFKLYDIKNDEFVTEEPEVSGEPMLQAEINAFIDCVQTGAFKRSHIDNVIRTAQIMQGIYDSSEKKREIVF